MTGPRGAPERVARAHAHARRTLALAALFAVAAPVAAVAPHDSGAWLPLHLFLVGGLLSAISGATQMLAVTWSSSPAPAGRAVAVQRWAIAAGAVAVATGREIEVDAVLVGGGAALVVGLGLLGAILLRIRASAVTDRYAPAIEAYLAAVLFGVVGVVLGVLVAAADLGSWWGEARAAHLTVNVFGLVGLVIAGTVPYFTATQARMKMAPAATPRRLRSTTTWLSLATIVAAGGHVSGHPVVAAAGLVAYAGGLLATVALAPRVGRRQLDWAGPRLLQLGAGMAWWLLATCVLASRVAAERGDQSAALRALAVGGFAQILYASLSYLGPVLRGGGHVHLRAGFDLTRSWPALVAANVAAVGALVDAPPVLGAGLAAWALDGVVRAVLLVRAPAPTEAAVDGAGTTAGASEG